MCAFVLPLTVRGYGVKLCSHDRCTSSTCSNVQNSEYFVDETHIDDLANQCNGSPIVLNHQDEIVICRVTSAYHEAGQGLYIEGCLDDYHFLTHAHKSFAQYSNKGRTWIFLRI